MLLALARPSPPAALATSTYTINLRLAAQQLDLRATVGRRRSASSGRWRWRNSSAWWQPWSCSSCSGRRAPPAGGRRVLAICIRSFALAVRWSATSPRGRSTRSDPCLAARLVPAGARLAPAGGGGVAPAATGRPGARAGHLAVVVVLVGRSAIIIPRGGRWPRPRRPCWSWPGRPSPRADRGRRTASPWCRCAGSGVRSYSWYLWRWPAMVLLSQPRSTGASVGGRRSWPPWERSCSPTLPASWSSRCAAPWLVPPPVAACAAGPQRDAPCSSPSSLAAGPAGRRRGPSPKQRRSRSRQVDARRLGQAAGRPRAAQPPPPSTWPAGTPQASPTAAASTSSR